MIKKKTEIVDVGQFKYEVYGNDWKIINAPDKKQQIQILINELNELIEDDDCKEKETQTKINGVHVLYELGNMLKLYNYNICNMLTALKLAHTDYFNSTK